jgi:hypothetical protein
MVERVADLIEEGLYDAFASLPTETFDALITDSCADGRCSACKDSETYDNLADALPDIYGQGGGI